MSGLKHKDCSLYCRVPLMPKMLLLTVLTGVVIWSVLDHFQYLRLKNILYAQQSERLGREAQNARILFDNYIAAYSRAAKLFVSQKQFADYLDKESWLSGDASYIKWHAEIPPWLPDASVLRKFTRIHYALLFDRSGAVREVYQGWPDPLPESLTRPDNLLQIMSANQSLMTEIDGIPFVITSESVTGPGEKQEVTMVLASPLNDDFLKSSQGLAASQNIIALVSEKDSVIASNRADLLPVGTPLKGISDQYIITGKSFFDHGASDLLIQFTSFISKEEYENLSRAILSMEHRQYIVSALVFILSFGVIIFWITRHIQRLTREISDFSEQVLGSKQRKSGKGDEIHTLRESFRYLSAEVIESRNALIGEARRLEESQDELESKNREIDDNRQKLQLALDEISSLIRQVANKKSLDVRFSNPNLKECYKVMGCNNDECQCYGNEAVRCWQIAGTYCLGKPIGEFANKLMDCTECPVYKDATSNPFYQIGEHFNNMMHILEMKNHDLEVAYTSLKTTQSQLLQREKMASIGQLAAGVAHEINNPMGFISSNLASLGKYINKLTEFINIQNEALTALNAVETMDGFSDKRKKMKIDFIIGDIDNLIAESLDGAERVTKIVQNLKSFSRVDETEYKYADLNECVESTMNIVWNELKYKATVTKEYGELPQLKCYPHELNQVFMNLLVNSSQAIEKQGEIRIKTWNGNGSVNISISDTGCGIPKDKISRIFEPFFTTKEVGEGTGLGLSISYDIVKKHRGEIKVESEAGKGAVFTVSIPCNEA